MQHVSFPFSQSPNCSKKIIQCMFMTMLRVPGSIIISFILSPASSTACVLWDNIVSHAILQPCNNTNNSFERDQTCMYLLPTSPFLNYPIAPLCNWIHRFPQLTHLLILILSILNNLGSWNIQTQIRYRDQTDGQTISAKTTGKRNYNKQTQREW